MHVQFQSECPKEKAQVQIKTAVLNKVGIVRLVRQCGLNSSGPGYGPVMRSCEHGNKSSSPLRVEVLLDSQMTRSLSSNNQPLPHELTSLLCIDNSRKRLSSRLRPSAICWMNGTLHARFVAGGIRWPNLEVHGVFAFFSNKIASNSNEKTHNS